MDNKYPPNSDRSREQEQPERRDYPRMTGGVRLRDKTWLDHVRSFFNMDECVTFRDYVNALSDVASRVFGAIDTLTGGRPASSSSGGVPGARISYSNYYNQPAPQQQQKQTQRVTGGFEDIEFDIRSDAEVVLYRMAESMTRYQRVSVYDIFDFAGVTDPNGYVDQKYGWTDPAAIRAARIIKDGTKYRIYGLPLPAPF